MTHRRLFGTDGMRGVAGRYPLDQQTVLKFGRALGDLLRRMDGTGRPEAVLGEDTRESSRWISEAVAAGVRSSGVKLSYAGVITTPGVAFLTRQHAFSAGIMVSASHNPYSDNGIKVFSNSGVKLSEAQEAEIERALEEESLGHELPQPQHLVTDPAFLEQYVAYLGGILPSGFKLPKAPLVADCANGAASRVGPLLFKRLGIDARILNASPDGRNINFECGSLYPATMAREAQSSGAFLGVAFDGDADRAIFATKDGHIAHGDHVLYAVAPYFEQYHKLKGHTVVGTQMTNLALERALEQHGIGLKRTAVGDRYVLEEMLRSGYNLGGEPSGHIIFADLSLAGDGIVTLLQIIRILAESGASFAELVSGLKLYPQTIRNVRVREKRPLESVPEVVHTIDVCKTELGKSGRIVVRYSGTEPLLRIMVEAEKSGDVQHYSECIAKAVESAIGAK